MNNTFKWDSRDLELAAFVSRWSKDPSTQVGAVITRDNRVVSLGFNGFPSGIGDTDERLNNRDAKLQIVVHAEINAIVTAKQDLSGCTIYVFPFMPCSQCCSALIQAGIKRIVSLENNNERWASIFMLAKEMFLEAGVELILVEAVLA